MICISGIFFLSEVFQPLVLILVNCSLGLINKYPKTSLFPLPKFSVTPVFLLFLYLFCWSMCSNSFLSKTVLEVCLSDLY